MPCPNDHRRRSVTIAFRTTPEDAARIDQLVALSGMTKQDYIVRRLECEDIIVVPSITVQKNLRVAMDRVCCELSRLVDISQADKHAIRLAETLMNVYVALGADLPTDINRDHCPGSDQAHAHAAKIIGLER